MTIVAALTVTMTTIDDSFNQLFTLDKTETYLDVDLVMTYDANSVTRIMNKRTIAEDYADRFQLFRLLLQFLRRDRHRRRTDIRAGPVLLGSGDGARDPNRSALPRGCRSGRHPHLRRRTRASPREIRSTCLSAAPRTRIGSI
ncbi:MAG: hypothetical protein M0C28_19085 [Candidatus Moduliflexus flocculans]|nr:hypothetical protein [Candidatus Moduliflexus flocculans]